MSERWIKASFFQGLRDPRGLPIGIELGHFVADVSRFPWTREKTDLPLVSFATFKGTRRALANVETVTALAFDVDAPSPTVEAFAATLRAAAPWLACSFHTSFSSTPGALRFRLLAPISRPLLPDEHRAVWPVWARELALAGVAVDAACKDPSRAYFVPVRPPCGLFESGTLPGEPLDVDGELEVAREVREADEAEQASARAVARPSRFPTGTGRLSPFERAERYVRATPGAIAGSGGHAHTFRLALKLVGGFGLTDDQALAMLLEWSATCSPPWARKELERKVHQARTQGRAGDRFMLEARP